MTISHRIQSQQITGLLTPFVGVDMPFATLSGSFRLTRLDLRVTDPPSGGTVVAQVNTTTGGGGSALLQGTIPDGDRSVSVTGNVAIAGDTSLYLRVISESGAALNLSASVEISLPTGGTVTAFLSTLQNVKDALDVAGSSDDAVIQRHLEGVSKAMQRWMARDILETVYVGELHYPTGMSDAIVLRNGPVSIVTEVRVAGSVLDTAGYRREPGRLLRRLYAGARAAWSPDVEVAIDYTAGYAASPSDLVDACTTETARRFLQSVRGKGPGPHVISHTPEVGDGRTFETDGFLKTTIEAMKPYRRVV